MAKFRKIGVLSSGGDAPGMNAAIRSVTRKALQSGIEVMGIRGGYEGLLNGDLVKLDTHAVSQIITHGGTVLYSSRSPRFKTPEGMNLALKTCEDNEIDAIVAIGGDGTFRGATDLTNHGIPSIGIPGTIDNDITATEYTIGFDTAMNTVLGMIDALRETCESHNRCNVIEVMGRDCGMIALYSGISTGALAIAIPEIPFDEKYAIEKLIAARMQGKRGLIAVTSEGMKPVEGGKNYSEYFVEQIESISGIETRFARCGHIIRGGAPTIRDRVMATEMGYEAVNELLAGKSNEVICYIDGKIKPVDINYALILDRMYKNKLVDGDLDKFTADDIAKMRETCSHRSAMIRHMYQMAMDISF
ncbi:MAG: 6-phosphofructokinase [Clostridia bacterium]|nr:6-phosphofructokinase [Clostridia bacterium]